MHLKRQAIMLASAMAATFAAVEPAEVHPHVFAEARLDVILSEDHQSVKALRHLWRFDDLFSSTVMMEFDKNSDLKLDDKELKEVADTVHSSLAEFNYFQLVTQDGKDVAMTPPPHLMANFDNDQLIILFESEPKVPIRLAGKIDIGVYDPTFYTAIDFTDDANLTVEGLPSTCTKKVIRPDPDEAIAENQKSLTEAFFNDPTGTDMSKIFATKLELNCSPEG
ncbi:DUF1007 family protein [Mesorhizobium sp. M4A.F.Ca.ET.020.02.1.1]|uniref:DUF1007 family protein n=1 Tax=unclassified Mesorhizobium TaxID=325217 RepID=UPI000FCA40DB|nr:MULTISPECIES: DUF1007 family protein [unclassified Mesorhizobium]RUX42772.1 DUF1007 family protein [Mesorhizobium sp. M4A.F.Ca.ET.050.02.1.1]RVD35116.1 DUF1007 family protein [Mesorhizobium sp. M4A.F.Ca.ET.020.02.1.1]RWC15231.1 MAG: DUF1007 family protein [Mesorhizobium sp.]RWD24217.1 MAG: DUF1007 family protein [Mesorhizobium sp.]RWD33523.1 MAG: DUF1007 family protein [Mesorhizobium sp.]